MSFPKLPFNQFKPKIPDNIIPSVPSQSSPPLPPTPQIPALPNGGIIPSPSRELATLDFKRLIGGPLIACVRAQAAAALSTVDFIKTVGFKPQVEATDENPNPGSMEPIYVTFKYPKEVMPYQPATLPTLLSIKIEKPGKGYKNPPTLKAPETVIDCELRATIDKDGKLETVEIIRPGLGWTSSDKIEITPAPGGADGPTEAAQLKPQIRDARDAQPAIYDTMVLQVPLLTMLPVPYLRIEEVNLEFDVNIDQTESMDITATVDTGSGGGVGVDIYGAGGANMSCSFSTKVEGAYSNSINRKYSMNVKVKATQAEMPAGLERILGILQSSMMSMPLSTVMPKT